VTRLAFDAWLPDQPQHANPGALEAKNVISEVASYRSLANLSAFTDALPGPCLATTWIRTSTDQIFNFAGDETGLYRLDGTNWTNVSKSGGYAVSNWEFVNYGNLVIALSVSEPPQVFDTRSDTVFSDLAGSPPNAARGATVRDFVVLGDLNDGNAQRASIQWSGFNNSTQWVPSVSTQSDRQDLLNDSGPVRKIIGGDRGIVFQERGISVVTYIGPPVVFDITEVEKSRGTAAPDSVVWSGTTAFYYAPDGFYAFDINSGGGSVPIGQDQIDQWFLDRADPPEIVNMRGAVDREHTLAMWAFKSVKGAPTNDTLLIYNWSVARWSYAEIDIEYLNEFAIPGATLENMDAVLGGNIDSASINVDSTAFIGGAINLLAFNASHQAATFSGEPLSWTMETKEFSQENSYLFINQLRPLIETADTTDTNSIRLRIGQRNTLSESVVYTELLQLSQIFDYRFRVNARYLRFSLHGTIHANHITGVEFTPETRGVR